MYHSLGHRGHPGLKASRGHLGRKVLRDQPGCKGLRASRVQPVRQAHRGHRAQ